MHLPVETVYENNMTHSARTSSAIRLFLTCRTMLNCRASKITGEKAKWPSFAVSGLGRLKTGWPITVCPTLRSATSFCSSPRM
jgi:hypothetical protein